MSIEKVIISLIVAVSENNVIGKDNKLIWHLPNDMKFFKKTTLNHYVITGRKNYLSIPKKHRPLINRTNIILTRQTDFKADGCIICHSLEDAIAFAKKNKQTEIFIIGGGQIYKEALQKSMIDKMYVTHIHHKFDGDTFFPEISNSKWKKIKESKNPIDEKHQYAYSFAVYQKMN